MDNKWRKVFGVNEGNQSTIGSIKILEKMILIHRLPSSKKLYKSKIKEVFLGYFLSGLLKFTIFLKYGFKSAKIPKTGYYNFADIDDEF